MRKLVVILIAVVALSIFFFRNQKQHTVHETDAASETLQVSNQKHEITATSRNVPNIPQKRTVASTQNTSPERALLVNLITTTRQAENKSDLREKAQELREQLNSLPNKNQVLWDYYRDLQSEGIGAFERVEILDLMNGAGGNKQLGEVALAEALDFAPEAVMRPEQARTQEEMNKALSTDPSSIPVLVAFDIFLNNCGTYATCQQGLLTVIANNPNHNMRASLISTVNKRFPQQQKEFAADLARYQLN